MPNGRAEAPAASPMAWVAWMNCRRLIPKSAFASSTGFPVRAPFKVSSHRLLRWKPLVTRSRSHSLFHLGPDVRCETCMDLVAWRASPRRPWRARARRLSRRSACTSAGMDDVLVRRAEERRHAEHASTKKSRGTTLAILTAPRSGSSTSISMPRAASCGSRKLSAAGHHRMRAGRP